MTAPTGKADALVIFGATGDLAKLETFPALVGLVERGVLDVPVVGVARSGWDVGRFRDYASQSLHDNGIDPASPAAVKMLGLLRYIDGDLDSSATYDDLSREIGPAGFSITWKCRPPCSAGSPMASRPRAARRDPG